MSRQRFEVGDLVILQHPTFFHEYNGAPGVVVAGHYDDTLRKVDGRWLFSKRAIVIDYAAPAPATPGGTSSE